MNARYRLSVNEKQRDVDTLMETSTKHYMRREVWLPIATERHQLLNRAIRYFTLTTPALFDVKTLEQAGLIEKTARGYPGVGFCEKEDKIYSDIVRSLRWCGLSHKGTFEDMVLRQSKLGPGFSYDVVNLDFTWVPFPDKESPLEGTWGAIKRLLEVQRQNGVSFDLFITFKGSRQGTDQESIARVAELLQQNLQSGRGVPQFEKRIGHLDPRRLLSEDYVTFLAVGLPKLLVSDALEIGFNLSRINAYSYPRGEKSPYHIVKFVFSLEIPENTGRQFASVPALVANYDTAVPTIFANPLVDVGYVIESSPELREALETDVANLKALN